MEIGVPEEVAEAFEYHEELWKTMSMDTRKFMFMAIPFSTVHGKALVLKEYAIKHPGIYIYALANGYITETEAKKRQIRNWYQGALLRMEDGRDPDGFAKEAVEEVVHYLGGDEILADISIFNKNQLQKKNV